MLLAFQFTAALLFTVFSSSFDCENSDADLEGRCQLVNVYISFASWIVPVMLFLFVSYFMLVCFRVSRQSPTLWRTPVRFCPWNDIPKVISDKQRSSNTVEQNEAGGSVASASRLSLPSSSRGSSQTLTPSLSHEISLARPTQGASQSISHPPTPSSRVSTQTMLPYRMHRSMPPPLRAVSQPPPARATSRPPSSRVSSQLPPSLVVSGPLPLSHPVGLSKSQWHSHTISIPHKTERTYHMKRPSNLERYCDEWNRNRRSSGLHPTWIA
ncbi:hypothetical protein K439DRAFT_269088 [Ramaria rubella]|nr:hypothetical protein K439DRAFT_269088 [Ramaria rubella]